MEGRRKELEDGNLGRKEKGRPRKHQKKGKTQEVVFLL